MVSTEERHGGVKLAPRIFFYSRSLMGHSADTISVHLALSKAVHTTRSDCVNYARFHKMSSLFFLNKKKFREQVNHPRRKFGTASVSDVPLKHLVQSAVTAASAPTSARGLTTAPLERCVCSSTFRGLSPRRPCLLPPNLQTICT